MPRKRLKPIRIDWKKSSSAWGLAFSEEWRTLAGPIVASIEKMAE